MKAVVFLIPLLGLTGCQMIAGTQRDALRVARVQDSEISEGSALTASAFHPELYWVVNDSGHDPELFLISAKGETAGKVRIEGAVNRDWETLAADGEGRLWIGDTGNNGNERKDLTVFEIREPVRKDPLPDSLEVVRSFRIRFPDQETFPPPRQNFDCEAMFYAEELLYFLTKHRSDRDTKLYKLDLKESGYERELTLIERRNEIGQVTGCDLHPDGKRLAVLTYSGIWIFTRSESNDRFLSGEKQVVAFPNWALLQCEAIAWSDEDSLLITNEQRDIFRVPLHHFIAVP